MNILLTVAYELISDDQYIGILVNEDRQMVGIYILDDPSYVIQIDSEYHVIKINNIKRSQDMKFIYIFDVKYKIDGFLPKNKILDIISDS